MAAVKRKTAADRVKIGSGSCGGSYGNGGELTPYYTTFRGNSQGKKKRASKKRRKRHRTSYRLYEDAKQRLYYQALDPEAYQAAVKDLARKLNI